MQASPTRPWQGYRVFLKNPFLQDNRSAKWKNLLQHRICLQKRAVLLLGQGAVARAKRFLDGSGKIQGSRAPGGAAQRDSRGFHGLRSRWPDGSELGWQCFVITAWSGAGSALNSFLHTLPSSLTLSMRQLARPSLQNCTNHSSTELLRHYLGKIIVYLAITKI